MAGKPVFGIPSVFPLRAAGWVSPAVAWALLAGCFHQPNVDVQSLQCASDENCPAGYTCNLQTAKCERPGSSRLDGGSADGVLGPVGEAGTGEATPPTDVPTVADGAASTIDGGRTGVDGSSSYDVNPEASFDVSVPDLPMGGLEAGLSDAPVTPTGGTAGHGGAGGALGTSDGGAPATGGATGIAGASGTGGISGGGGVPGTGGTPGGGGDSAGGGGSGGTPGSGG